MRSAPSLALIVLASESNEKLDYERCTSGNCSIHASSNETLPELVVFSRDRGDLRLGKIFLICLDAARRGAGGRTAASQISRRMAMTSSRMVDHSVFYSMPVTLRRLGRRAGVSATAH